MKLVKRNFKFISEGAKLAPEWTYLIDLQSWTRQLAKWKIPARNDLRMKLVLMKGTNTKKASSNFPFKRLGQWNFSILSLGTFGSKLRATKH